VKLVGISLDEPADSRVFAREYGITFPLLTDAGGAVSSQYTGLDGSGVSVPGIVVVRRSGEIAFRQIATTMADRPSLAEVVAIVDRTLAPATRPAIDDDYAALGRIQLRLDAGAGALRIEDAWRATGFGSLGALVPLHRMLVVGGDARIEAREQIVTLAGLVGVRVPIIGDAGALQLIGAIGAPAVNADGVYFGARAGVWFAMTPSLALQLELGGGTWSGDRELFATFGIARLLRF
jgi:hypothetical protein